MASRPSPHPLTQGGPPTTPRRPGAPLSRRWAAVTGAVLCSPAMALGVVVATRPAPGAAVAVWDAGNGNAPAAVAAAGDGGQVIDTLLAADGIPLPAGAGPAVSGLMPRSTASAPRMPSPATVAPAAGGGAMTGSGIPLRALRAYATAQVLLRRDAPACGIAWTLVAGVARIESDHGRFGGSRYGADGLVVPGILGPRLDGSRPGWATVRDTDGGRYDGDPVFDRAVGPFQFLPGTWRAVGADADGDGVADPQDLDDAALGAARYLCAGGEDLRTPGGQRAALFRYNRSSSYGELVMADAVAYARGAAAPVTALLPGRAPRPEPVPARVPSRPSHSRTEAPAPTGTAGPTPPSSTPTSSTPGATATPTPAESPTPTGSPSPTEAPTSTPPETPVPDTTGPSRTSPS